MDKTIVHLSQRNAVQPISFPPAKGSSSSFQKMLREHRPEPEVMSTTPTTQEQKILIGTISEDKQTVSELIMDHETLKSSGWNILSSGQNRHRDYTKLHSGTDIYYSPATGNLSWSRSQAEDNVQSRAVVLAEVEKNQSMEPSATHEKAPGMQVLGVINEQQPTVSHLLKNNESLTKDTWNILASESNINKNFRGLVPGTTVMYNPDSREITWQIPGSPIKAREVAAVAARGTGGIGDSEKLTLPPVFQRNIIHQLETEPSAAVGENQPVLLGRIDRNNNTVSHLLAQNPDFKDETWQLLNSSLNINKPFDKIAEGTEVYLNPDSREIFWSSADDASTKAVPQIAAALHKKVYREEAGLDYGNPASNLTEAVQPFMGKSYKDIDCYELLVEGLRRMDIPYEGKGGLLTKLTTMARDRGLPINAYMNGEGIVKAAGSLVFTKSIPETSNWRQDADNLIREIEPLLDKGQILSFSTENRGHTGIVSQQENQWTFINSGRLDNAVTANNPSRGVGEEVLQEEIRNWFKVAHKSGESLSITLGKLEQNKILTAYNMPEGLSEQI